MDCEPPPAQRDHSQEVPHEELTFDSLWARRDATAGGTPPPRVATEVAAGRATCRACGGPMEADAAACSRCGWSANPPRGWWGSTSGANGYEEQLSDRRPPIASRLARCGYCLTPVGESADGCEACGERLGDRDDLGLRRPLGRVHVPAAASSYVGLPVRRRLLVGALLLVAVAPALLCHPIPQ